MKYDIFYLEKYFNSDIKKLEDNKFENYFYN